MKGNCLLTAEEEFCFMLFLGYEVSQSVRNADQQYATMG